MGFSDFRKGRFYKRPFDKYNFGNITYTRSLIFVSLTSLSPRTFLISSNNFLSTSG